MLEKYCERRNACGRIITRDLMLAQFALFRFLELTHNVYK